VDRIVATLERRSYLHRSAGGRYRFGLKLVSLGHAALQGMPLREAARPILGELAQQTAMTVHLSVLERGEAVIIEKMEAPGQPRLATWVGRRLDVNCTGAGKALVAHLPMAEFDRLYRPGSFARHNEYSIVSVKRLKVELAETRSRGYALDDEEDEIGVRCVGVPVFGKDGAVVAAISVSCQTANLAIRNVPAIAAILRASAGLLSARLRSAGPE
jgi:DNA-binding IclR family transcriptional regulator